MQLSDSAQTIWDQLDNKMKAIILGLSNSESTGSTNKDLPVRFSPGTKPPVQSQQPSLRRRINLHDVSAHDLIETYMHQVDGSEDEDDNKFKDAVEELPSNENEHDNCTVLVNAAKSSTHLPPGDIQRILSSSAAKGKESSSKKMEVNTHIIHKTSQRKTSNKTSLIDRGANGGVAGSDVQIIQQATPRTRCVDIQSIGNCQLKDVPIGTVGGVITTQFGPTIAIMHQYALYGQGQTIHSSGQLEWNKVETMDKSIYVGGLQHLRTSDDYYIPLIIKNGLPRLKIRPYTDREWNTLPQVILTSPMEWDPTVLDYEYNTNWFGTIKRLKGMPQVAISKQDEAFIEEMIQLTNPKEDEPTTKMDINQHEQVKAVNQVQGNDQVQENDHKNCQTIPTTTIQNIQNGVSTTIIHISHHTLLKTIHRLTNSDAPINLQSSSITYKSPFKAFVESLGGEGENPSKRSKPSYDKDLQHSKLCDSDEDSIDDPFDINEQMNNQFHPVRIIKLAKDHKDTLQELGFEQLSGTRDIWKRSCDGVHVYMLIYPLLGLLIVSSLL